MKTAQQRKAIKAKKRAAKAAAIKKNGLSTNSSSDTNIIDSLLDIANENNNNSKMNFHIREILKLTLGDLKQQGQEFNPVALDIKEILRYGEMVPTNCMNILNYVKNAGFIERVTQKDIKCKRINYTPYEHYMILEEALKTVEVISVPGVGLIIQYKDYGTDGLEETIQAMKEFNKGDLAA